MSLSPDELKKELRVRMRGLRRGQDPALARQRARAAQQALLDWDVWQQAARVALYVALPEEVHTGYLLADAWQRRVRVYLPRVRLERGLMDFVPCSRVGDMAAGPYKMLEPHAGLLGMAPPVLAHPDFCPDVLILPGVAFDRAGNRQGFGGGYYDRFLAAFGARGSGRRPLLVGLCYAFQVVDALPSQDWDRPVDCLCTEEGLVCL